MDEVVLPQLNYFAEYAAAAGCQSTIKKDTELECPDKFCPTITNNTVHTMETFADAGKSDISGLLAHDVTTRTIVLAFRGTVTLRNMLTNLAVKQMPWEDVCKECTVHTGFHHAYWNLRKSVVDSVKKLTEENPDYSLVTVGYSLGGALATIAAADLRQQGLNATLYTYGAPRVGNPAFAQSVSRSGVNYRVTNLDDPIPMVPPVTMGFAHVEPEFHITKDGHPVKAGDIMIYPELVNYAGNSGAGSVLNFNMKAHRHYFLEEKIGTCGEKKRNTPSWIDRLMKGTENHFKPAVQPYWRK